jgi:nicotinamide-nucleotide amidase
MNAEIICVGTELLLGEVLNSNAQFLAAQLADLGISHYHQTVVGDNVERLKQVVAIACGRAQLLIFTGGLGPTPDDLTTATLADFFATPLVEHPEVIADIERKFAQRRIIPPDSNRRQAWLPLGATVLSNSLGTAPGMIWQPLPGLTLLTFPGVPAEMKQMWGEIAVPYLCAQGWVTEGIYSRVLRFWGISESALAEKVEAYLALAHPTVAPYAGDGEARLRISARAASDTLARQWIDPVEHQIRALTGLDCYGADQETLSTVVGQLLRARGETLSVAESCTGGGLGQLITEAAGSSEYFVGGAIAYENRVKTEFLGVNPETIATQGAVSSSVAQQMAQGIKARFATTWGLSITGIAGPGGGTVDKPVGLVWVGLAGPAGLSSQECQFSSIRGRDWIRQLSARAALDYLRRILLSSDPQSGGDSTHF